jgi:hypothetical protein
MVVETPLRERLSCSVHVSDLARQFKIMGAMKTAWSGLVTGTLSAWKIAYAGQRRGGENIDGDKGEIDRRDEV